MVVTRFAPSPTGYLHVGSARTALYAWLYARHTKGKYILRIEDTDLERSTQEAVDVILEGMRWLGLDWDAGPYYQTQHFDRYKEIIQKLMDDGHAYKCYCSKERLEKLRAEQMAQKIKPKYDGLCRHNPQDKNEPFVVRFKNPEEGSVVIEDVVKGRIEINNSELDDLILARSDGTPTYNLTVVVDDFDMKVTHVIRGDDHINNTPRQINILKALGAPIPEYGHIPMILGSDGKKLSKRHGAVSVLEYSKEGILPQALINYLVRLGWSHGDQEIFTMEEMIEFFDVVGLNKSAAAFNPEKLLWLNQHYLKTSSPAMIASELANQFSAIGVDVSKGTLLTDLIPVQAERCKTLVEMAEQSRYFYEDIQSYDETGVYKHFTPEAYDPLKEIRSRFEALVDWNKEAISGVIKTLAGELNLGLGKLMPPIRLAVTGTLVSPSVDVTLELVGKAKTLQRLDAALSKIKEFSKA